MRRVVTLAVLLFLAVPVGISLSGCSKASTAVFCNGQSSGVVIGQTTTLNLQPRLTGITLNEGEIGSIQTPTAQDCKGNSASISGLVYASSDITLLDVNPATGSICAGSWNRFTGGGVPDFTTCTPNNRQGTVYVTASAEAVVSNAIPVYIHPVVTGIVLGPASTNCTTDPATNCALDATQFNGCSAVAPAPVATYDGSRCFSQGDTVQLAARAFKGNDPTNPANNISCLIGPLSFAADNSAVLTITTNGLATAAQPGSSIITAANSQSSSSTGFFSTCPPRSITLTTPGRTTPPAGAVPVPQNTAQNLVTSIFDTNITPAFPNGHPLTNIQLTYVSTSPTTIPAAGSVITPTFPGAAAITAECLPPNCNASPFNQIGLFGNGTTVISNPVQINASGTNSSTVLYIASTGSQYIQPIDFTVPTQPSAVRLPYVPNSLVLSEDLSTIYMGNSNEIMIFSTFSNALSKQDNSVSGTVLAVSPDNTTVIVTDPVRKLTYLYLAAGGISTEYGGVATHAAWTPDSSTVYITTTDSRLLVHSSFTGWTSINLPNLASDVAVTVPSAGIYLGAPAGATVTGRTNCPATTVSGTGLNQTTSNTFYPQVDVTPAQSDRLAATNDGVHILGASVTRLSDLATNQKSGACPVPFTSSLAASPLFTGLAATSITGVLPTSDSAFAFVTYTGTGGLLPQYAPAAGSLTNIPLQKTAAGSPIAPITGVLSSDNQTLFLSTTGDNLVHRLTRTPTGFTDTVTPLTPNLPGINGGTATPDLLAQRPRKSTS